MAALPPGPEWLWVGLLLRAVSAWWGSVSGRGFEWPRLTVRMRGLDERPVSCLVQESPLCSMASSRPPFQVPVMASPL